MKHVIVSFLVAILLIVRLPVKTAGNITRIADITISLKNQIDTVTNHANGMAQQFVEYAKSFIGIPYRWGSTNPKLGFDCSGFVNYVSQHFGMTVPRSSAQFTNVGVEVVPSQAQAGDLILFTGTNLKNRRVGHMGIVVDNNDDALQFIHSSSGKKKGVHVSDLAGYYKQRLVKIIRIFPLDQGRVLS
jgi:cell wall-associated NlpC family hydrolase